MKGLHSRLVLSFVSDLRKHGLHLSQIRDAAKRVVLVNLNGSAESVKCRANHKIDSDHFPLYLLNFNLLLLILPPYL